MGSVWTFTRQDFQGDTNRVIHPALRRNRVLRVKWRVSSALITWPRLIPAHSAEGPHGPFLDSIALPGLLGPEPAFVEPQWSKHRPYVHNTGHLQPDVNYCGHTLPYISDTAASVCIILDMNAAILHRLAGEIKSMRMQRGLSQLQLAEAAGVNRKTIIELEKGSTGIALGTVVAVLESMGGELAVKPVSKPTTSEVQALLGLGHARASFDRLDVKGRVGAKQSPIGSLHFSTFANDVTKVTMPRKSDAETLMLTRLDPDPTQLFSTTGGFKNGLFVQQSKNDAETFGLTSLVPTGTKIISRTDSTQNGLFAQPFNVDARTLDITSLAPAGKKDTKTPGDK